MLIIKTFQKIAQKRKPMYRIEANILNDKLYWTGEQLSPYKEHAQLYDSLMYANRMAAKIDQFN